MNEIFNRQVRSEGEDTAGSNTVVNIIEQHVEGIQAFGIYLEEPRGMKVPSVQGIVSNTWGWGMTGR